MLKICVNIGFVILRSDYGTGRWGWNFFGRLSSQKIEVAMCRYNKVMHLVYGRLVDLFQQLFSVLSKFNIRWANTTLWKQHVLCRVRIHSLNRIVDIKCQK